MLRPPRLLSFLIIAAGSIGLFVSSALAQPSWDSDSDDDSDAYQAEESSDDSPEDSYNPPPAAPSPAPVMSSAGAGGGSDENIDARLEEVAGYVKDLQAPLRAYTAGWVGLQVGLAGYFGYDATLRQHERSTRTYDVMMSTIAGLNSLLVLTKPMPGRSAWRKFKKMPEGTLEEKRAKVDFGVRMIGAQIAADREATKPEEHILAALVGIGFGAGLIFGYDDGLRNGVQATLGVILLAELQFATRPHRTRRYNRDLAAKEKPPVELGFAPMVTPWSQGLSVGGRF